MLWVINFDDFVFQSRRNKIPVYQIIAHSFNSFHLLLWYFCACLFTQPTQHKVCFNLWFETLTCVHTYVYRLFVWWIEWRAKKEEIKGKGYYVCQTNKRSIWFCFNFNCAAVQHFHCDSFLSNIFALQSNTLCVQYDSIVWPIQQQKDDCDFLFPPFTHPLWPSCTRFFLHRSWFFSHFMP